MPPKRRLSAPVPEPSTSEPPQSRRKQRLASSSSSPSSSSPPQQSTNKSITIPTYTPILIPADGGAYKHRQLKSCPREAEERCVSCIEKQAVRGGCRFVGIRAFRAEGEEVKWGEYAFRGNQDEADEPGVKEGEKEKKMEKGKKNGEKAPKKKKEEKEERVGERRSSRRTRGAGVDDVEKEEGTDGATREPEIPVPDKIEPTIEDAEYVLPLIAPVFARHLKRELQHEIENMGTPSPSSGPEKMDEDTVKEKVGKEGEEKADPRPLIRIKNTPLTRSLCDFCVTSIFLGSYMCACCGREFCLGCWETWTPSSELHAGRLLKRNQCSFRRRHEKRNMIFVTRAKEGELRELLADVESKVPTTEMAETTRIYTLENEAAVAAIPTETAPQVPNDGVTYLPVPKTSIDDFSESIFRSLWRVGGIPLVLTGLLPRFKLPWSPEYFTKHFGKTTCTLHDCTTSEAIVSTVADFFSIFSSTSPTSSAPNSWKLKDWPPSADFESTFPALFRDFENAVPFPEYTRRTGPRNLAGQAYFDKIWNPPDLGPKMYNALPAPDFLVDYGGEEVKGTTNLHLDLTDAVNVLLYTTPEDPCPYDSMERMAVPECAAIWDIFPPDAADGIRKYLKDVHQSSSSPSHSKNGSSNNNNAIDDPIHRQLFYLSESDLLALSKPPYNIHAYRIFQNPGDAVWIPAGCAHQVRNRKASVKVAVDFFSPESVARGVAERLLKEARDMMQERVGTGWTSKEDVVQMWACLAFVWRALREVQNRHREKEEGLTDGGVVVGGL